MVVGVTSAQTCLVLRGRLRALREAGFDVTLISSPGWLLERTAVEEGVSSQAISMERGFAPFADMAAFLGILWFLLRHRPKLVDFSTPKVGLLGCTAAWLLRIPHRVYTLRGLKLETSRGWKRHTLLLSERIAAGCADVVLCNSRSLLEEAAAMGIAREKKFFLLGEGSSNGVDTERFHPGRTALREMMDIPAEDAVIGFVGRLTRDKGVPELLMAFDAILDIHPQCWLLLVGWFDASDDELDGHWKAHIADHPRIRHTGFVANVEEYYRAMDFFVLPTHREGFPNAVLEAAASGLAAITTESTGARDAVLPEITGFVVPPENPAAITEAALLLLKDEPRRRKMGEAARAWAVERFSQKAVLGLAVEFYRKLIEREK